MGNKAVDARLLAAEEPSDRSPVAVQPQRTAVSSSCARTTRPNSGDRSPLGGAMAPQDHVCVRVHMIVAYCTMIASIHQ